jgi:hypothetical protein
MKKYILIACIIMTGILFITGCKPPDKPPLSEAEANTMISEVSIAVQAETQEAMTEAIAGAMEGRQPVVRTDYIVNYTNDAETVIITGTLSFDEDDGDGDTDIFPVDYTMIVVFDNYVPVIPGDVTFIDGTTTSTVHMESYTHFTSSYSGDFTTVYKGEEYECSWLIDTTITDTTIEYSGTYTVDDYSYTYSGTYNY